MSLLAQHHRNHSFPPSGRPVQNPAKSLKNNKPLPDIDDEPFVHFLASPDDEDNYADYLHFDAGILVESESYKRKINKFRPASRAKRDTIALRQHHGLFAHRGIEHGFVLDRTGVYSPLDQHHSLAVSAPADTRQPRHRSHKHQPGHRHSWQEPSLDLFTVTEEIPQIVVSDYDDELTSLEPAESASTDGTQHHHHYHEAETTVEEDKGCSSSAGITAAVTVTVTDSPRLGACEPAEKPDTQLNRMWFGERARL